MKIRVTLMTENDKHLPNMSKEEIEAKARMGWEMLMTMISIDAGENERGYVESCELVEE